MSAAVEQRLTALLDSWVAGSVALGAALAAATHRGQYVDMIKKRMTDPAEVSRSAMQHATSIATLFVTTPVGVRGPPQAGARRLASRCQARGS